MDNTEWTAIMSVFLSDLASVPGNLTQDWEWGPRKIDYAWYKGSDVSRPLVLIEHEQQRYNQRKGKAIWWPPLKLHRASRELAENGHADPLCVLITYEYVRRYNWIDGKVEPAGRPDFPVGWVHSEVEKVLAGRSKHCRTRFAGSFLLIVGSGKAWPADPSTPYPWRSYQWTGRSLEFLGQTRGWGRDD